MIENSCDNKDCEVLRKTFGDKCLKCEECPQYKDIQIKQLGERCNQLLNDKGELIDRCRELEAQIEKMKADVNTNIKVAQQKKDWLMESKLVSMILQWEGKKKQLKKR